MSRIIFFTLLLHVCKCNCTLPNIIFVLIDDLGSNDGGYTGMNQIPTPNMDALAASGIIMRNHYTTPLCTPSRAALLTGKYPIHTGMQHDVVYATEPRGLPLNETLLSEYLQDLSYETHLVGKWHLGHYKKEYMPPYRGFKSFRGHLGGRADLFTHILDSPKGYWGIDMWNNMTVDSDSMGNYRTTLYADRCEEIISAHNASLPLFLMLSHSAMHSGNADEPMRAPDELIEQFDYIENYYRRKYAAILTKVDESIGRVVAALQSANLLSNSIIVLASDNGGPEGGHDNNQASNYPLRGGKNTTWEGGVRGISVLWSPLIQNRSRVAYQKFHMVDWLPTLLGAAGMDTSTLEGLDGIDQWDALTQNLESNRTTLVHNIDDIYGMAAITIGEWKIQYGGKNYDARGEWHDANGTEGTYNVSLVASCLAGVALTELGVMPDSDTISALRKETAISCLNATYVACDPQQAPCLFNIEKDPCEMNNLADSEPEMLAYMLEQLSAVNATALTPNNKASLACGNPKYYNQHIVNFADYSVCTSS